MEAREREQIRVRESENLKKKKKKFIRFLIKKLKNTKIPLVFGVYQ